MLNFVHAHFLHFLPSSNALMLRTPMQNESKRKIGALHFRKHKSTEEHQFSIL